MSKLTSIGTITLSLMLFVADRMLFRALACATAGKIGTPGCCTVNLSYRAQQPRLETSFLKKNDTDTCMLAAGEVDRLHSEPSIRLRTYTMFTSKGP